MARIFDKELDRSANVIKSKLSQLCTEYGEQDVADWARCSVHMIQKYRNVKEHKYQMPAANLRLLSKQLTTVHDAKIIKDFTDSSQSVFIAPPGIADGSISEDIKELMKAVGEVCVCFDSEDKLGYQQAVDDLRKVLSNVEAEGEAMR